METRLDMEVPECIQVAEDQACELGCEVGIVTNGRGLWGVRINGHYICSLGPPEYVAEVVKAFLAKGFHKEEAMMKYGLAWVLNQQLNGA